MNLFLGLLSWSVLGCFIGWTAARFLPGEPRLAAVPAILVGFLCALLGGILASGLGFGGLATYDPRALLTAFLACCLGLTWWRITKLAG